VKPNRVRPAGQITGGNRRPDGVSECHEPRHPDACAVASEQMDAPRSTLKQHTIVICGSMTHYRVMLELQDRLRSDGIDAVVPEEENAGLVKGLSAEAYLIFKRVVSERYFRVIRQRSTFGILVVNVSKHDRENYVGANTFAEIAIAINARKRVYLLNDIYEPVKDELTAWGAISLRGDIGRIVADLGEERRLAERQLDLDLEGPQ